MTSMTDPSSSEAAPKKRVWRIAPGLLVYAGMLPFILGAVFIYRYDALIAAHPPMAAGDAAGVIGMRLQFALLSFLVYAALILSFLGGVRWGVELAKRPDKPCGVLLALSVLGALGGWALVLMGVMVKTDVKLFIAFALMFALHLVWDAASEDLPRWFKRLRFAASLAAIGSMLSVAWLFA